MDRLPTVGDRVSADVADGAFTITEAQEFSRISRAELYRRMERGELSFIKYGRRRLIPKNALRAFLASHVVAAVARPCGASAHE